MSKLTQKEIIEAKIALVVQKMDVVSKGNDNDLVAQYLTLEAELEQLYYQLDDLAAEEMENTNLRYKSMFKTMKPGVTAMCGEPVEVIGEQSVELEDGRVVEQYLYHIFGNPARNGKPYAALKSNIELTEQPVELPPVTVPTTSNVVCQSDTRLTKRSRKTGKEYSSWEFAGYSKLPNLREEFNSNWYFKNGKLHIETRYGLSRYHIQDVAEF